MLFTDPIFLFLFLPLFLLGFSLLGALKPGLSNIRKLFIVVATGIFYAYGDILWLIPFCIAALFDYLWASLIVRVASPIARKLLVTLSVVQNLTLFLCYKYIPGVASTEIADLFIVPGLSFYLFESLSFVIDVYRGRCVPPKNPLDFLCFLAMFPRFLAGPIVRYEAISDQLRSWKRQEVETGLVVFMIGYSVKILLADSAATFVPYAFTVAKPDLYSSWIGVSAYTVQIYADFYGYSLMAIGLGRTFGFHFGLNFLNPYDAVSLSDFWRRWHRSLSFWFRDYLYIPLGGNRLGSLRRCANTLITMSVAGLWHGVGWTFLVWGFLHGFCLLIEQLFLITRLRRCIQRLWTLGVVIFGWVLFRANSLDHSREVYRALFGGNGVYSSFNPEWIQTHVFSLVCFLIGSVWLLIYIPRRESPIEIRDSFCSFETFAAVGIFFIAVITMSSAHLVPFLYFRF